MYRIGVAGKPTKQHYTIRVVEYDISVTPQVGGTTDFCLINVHLTDLELYDFSFVREKGSKKNLLTEFNKPIGNGYPLTLTSWLRRRGARLTGVTKTKDNCWSNCPYTELIDECDAGSLLLRRVSESLHSVDAWNNYAPQSKEPGAFYKKWEDVNRALHVSHDDISNAYLETILKAAEQFKDIEAGVRPW